MTPKHRPAPSPLRARLAGWLARLGAALERAERKIADNFRVPPGGG